MKLCGTLAACAFSGAWTLWQFVTVQLVHVVHASMLWLVHAFRWTILAWAVSVSHLRTQAGLTSPGRSSAAARPNVPSRKPPKRTPAPSSKIASETEVHKAAKLLDAWVERIGHEGPISGASFQDIVQQMTIGVPKQDSVAESSADIREYAGHTQATGHISTSRRRQAAAQQPANCLRIDHRRAKHSADKVDAGECVHFLPSANEEAQMMSREDVDAQQVPTDSSSAPAAFVADGEPMLPANATQQYTAPVRNRSLSKYMVRTAGKRAITEERAKYGPGCLLSASLCDPAYDGRGHRYTNIYGVCLVYGADTAKANTYGLVYWTGGGGEVLRISNVERGRLAAMKRKLKGSIQQISRCKHSPSMFRFLADQIDMVHDKLARLEPYRCVGWAKQVLECQRLDKPSLGVRIHFEGVKRHRDTDTPPQQTSDLSTESVSKKRRESSHVQMQTAAALCK